MEKNKIERINFLAKKSKAEGLTENEKSEQKTLRDEYREEFKANFMAQIDNTYVIDKDGNKTKLIKDKSDD